MTDQNEEKYYTKTFVIEEYPTYRFNIDRITPTKLLPMLMISSGLKDKVDEEVFEKIYNFALSHTTITVNGVSVKVKDGDDFFPKEREDDMVFFQKVVDLFIANVFRPVFQGLNK